MRQSLTTIVAGASFLLYSGCSSNDRSWPGVFDAGNTAGAGGYGAGETTLVGGNGAGAGGSTGTGGNTGEYPKGVDSIKTHSSPEIMELVDCIIKKNEELQAYEAEHPVGFGGEHRTGIVMMGAAKCGECEQEREEIGIEGIKKLIDFGVYMDPFFNDDCREKARDVGVLYLPALNIIQVILVVTAEFPDGYPTVLKQQRERFVSLPTLAEMTGCTYKGE